MGCRGPGPSVEASSSTTLFSSRATRWFFHGDVVIFVEKYNRKGRFVMLFFGKIVITGVTGVTTVMMRFLLPKNCNHSVVKQFIWILAIISTSFPRKLWVVHIHCRGTLLISGPKTETEMVILIVSKHGDCNNLPTIMCTLW